LAPFLESYGLADTEEAAHDLCSTLCTTLRSLGLQQATAQDEEEVKQLDRAAKMNSTLMTAAEQEVLDATMWGLSSIRAKKNEVCPVAWVWFSMFCMRCVSKTIRRILTLPPRTRTPRRRYQWTKREIWWIMK
jgi:hypothetical protein